LAQAIFLKKEKNLYSYWGDTITEELNASLTKDAEPALVNLASAEYFKAINTKKLKAKVLNLSFKENKNGIYKVVAIHAKRARGQMVNYIIQNQIADIEAIKDFTTNGYGLNPSFSKDKEGVFCRD